MHFNHMLCIGHFNTIYQSSNRLQSLSLISHCPHAGEERMRESSDAAGRNQRRTVSTVAERASEQDVAGRLRDAALSGEH